MKQKFQFLFIPFFLLSLGFMLIYAVVYAWLVSGIGSWGGGVFSPNPALFDVWIPLMLLGGLVPFCLGSRIGLLGLSHWSFVFKGIMVLLILIPVYWMQTELRQREGLTAVNSMDAFVSQGHRQFYTLDSSEGADDGQPLYRVEPSMTTVLMAAAVSEVSDQEIPDNAVNSDGESNNHIDFVFTTITPLIPREVKDLSSFQPTVWAMKQTAKSLDIATDSPTSPRQLLADPTTQATIKQMGDRVQNTFIETLEGEVKYFQKLMQIPEELFKENAANDDLGEDLTGLPQNIEDFQDVRIFEPMTGKFEDRTKPPFYWSLGVVLVSCFIGLLLLLLPPWDGAAVTRFREEAKCLTLKGRVSHWLSCGAKEAFVFLIPTPGYRVTPVIVSLNVLLFVAMWASGLNPLAIAPEQALNWGAILESWVVDGQWWRLVSGLFIHGSFTALLLNLCGLILLGKILEPNLVKGKPAPWIYLACVLFLGVCSTLLQFTAAHDVFMMGASGVVFGLLGIFFVLFARRKIYGVTPPLVIGLLLLLGTYIILARFMDSELIFHRWGLLSGLVLGLGISVFGALPHKFVRGDVVRQAEVKEELIPGTNERL